MIKTYNWDKKFSFGLKKETHVGFSALIWELGKWTWPLRHHLEVLVREAEGPSQCLQ